MSKRSSLYKRHRSPPEINQHVVWLYHRFNLSSRDIEDLMAERGIGISYESSPTNWGVTVSLTASSYRIRFMTLPNMRIIEPSFHINRPGSESEVCDDSSQRLRPDDF